MKKTKSKKTKPFVFYECTNLIQPTGKKAENIRQLLSLIRNVEPGVIYNHTHQYYLKASIELPEYSNDFAVWAAEALEERALAEKVASLDLYAYKNIEEVRQGLISTLRSYLSENPEPRQARPGDAFFFNDTLSLIFAIKSNIHTLPEFLTSLRTVGTSSLYFHFFEAKMRMGRHTDDFSNWLEKNLGNKELASKIQKLDPYHYSLEELRQEILFILGHLNGKVS